MPTESHTLHQRRMHPAFRTFIIGSKSYHRYEPYTFNDYGSKIPLQEFRATTVDSADRTIVIDAANTGEVNVFMVMESDGDYEAAAIVALPSISSDSVYEAAAIATPTSTTSPRGNEASAIATPPIWPG